MSNAIWVLHLENVAKICLLDGSLEEQDVRLSLAISNLLSCSNRCTWSIHAIEVDVWKWSLDAKANLQDITCDTIEISSISDRASLLPVCAQSHERGMLCIAHLSLDTKPLHTTCDICQKVVNHASGISRQLFWCSKGHVGYSRHPGSDDALYWECAEELCSRVFHGPSCGRCEQIHSELEVCFSEAKACRSSLHPRDKVCSEWWRLLCVDIILFERDLMLMLCVSCWKRYAGKNIKQKVDSE